VVAVSLLQNGALTIWFNVQHAGTDPGRRLAAALPPVLMMLAFEIDVQIVKWVMRALGKPMGAATPLPPGITPAPYQLSYPGLVPGALYQPDGAPYGMVPPAFGTLPSAVPPPWWPYGQMPSVTRSGNPQNGHPAMGANGANGGGDQVDVIKRQQVEAYLGRLSPEQLAALTGSKITADLAAEGVEVTERYARRILDQWNAARRPAGVPRKRGVARASRGGDP